MKENVLTWGVCASKTLAIVVCAAALLGGVTANAAETGGAYSFSTTAPQRVVSGVVVDAKG